MKVGLFVNTQCPAGTDMGALVPALVEQVRTARESGFSSLWFPQHYLTAPMLMLQQSSILPYMLAHAQGMTVGGDILILPLQNPVAVAEDAATLDVLSGGRFVLGVGLGYREEEFAAFGVPLSERAPRFVESVRLIRRLWAEDTVAHEGRFFRVKGGIGARPVRKEGIPIWIAAQADAAIRRAAELGDSWLIIPSTGMAELDASLQVYKAALAANGKPMPVEFPITRECYVGESQASALEECRGPLAFKYGAYARWGLDGQDRENPDAAFQRMVRDCFIIGDKSYVKDQIARYRETLGVNHFIMRLHWPGFPQERVLRSIRALGEIFA
ncbi:MAG: LLM class flavin-dependent oxidoreductase [Burkholderiales bacterium]|nr:LLM class flavin-dependent oxidoreductase [Burkholderiales bacterium]